MTAPRRTGERGASASWTRWPTGSPIGVAAVVAVLDPGCVVLGGEVGRAGGADLAARVEERLGRMSPLPTEVRAGTLARRGGAARRGAHGHGRGQDACSPRGVRRPAGRSAIAAGADPRGGQGRVTAGGPPDRPWAPCAFAPPGVPAMSVGTRL